jgi:2-methylcitrate dehydratase PrpD
METRELARFIVCSQFGDIPGSVQDEAVRALVNWLGGALGGCLEPAFETALDALASQFGPAQATLLGRGDRADALWSAFFNALGSSALDFGDAHIATRIQPSAPVAAALFAAAEHRSGSGAQVVHAFCIGVEVACRAGLALGVQQDDHGRHNTATCGVLGAAAACAKLLCLDEQATSAALGIAATQAAGLNVVLGTPARSIDVAFAARNGLMAALLAEKGCTASDLALEGKRGFLSVLGGAQSAVAPLQELGTSWEVARLAYKPFACDFVLHPAVSACLELRHEYALRPSQIVSVGLRVAPVVLQIAATRTPQTGLESKQSVFHGAAVAFVDGTAGVRQFQDQRARNGRVAELRARVEAIADPQLGPDEAHVEVTLRDSRRYERRTRTVPGGPARPLTDAALSEKFRLLAQEVLATDQAERLLALIWNIRALGEIGSIVRASVAECEAEPAELPGSPLIPR